MNKRKDKRKILYHENPELHPLYSALKALCEKYDVNGDRTKKCLDVGSGRGPFQNIAVDYTGLDINGDLKKYYSKPFVCSSADNIPFNDNEFDITWSVWSLEHIENIEKTLYEIIRVTKEGGHIILAPAWRVRPWTSNGYRVRPYRDFKLKGKIYKLFIPLLDSKIVRAPIIIIKRLFVYLMVKKHKDSLPLYYEKLTPNYEVYWESDSNACNSLDQYALIQWFENKGCICVSHQSHKNKFLSKDPVIDIINVKTCKKLITYGDLNKGIHLRKNLEIFESLGIVSQSVDINDLPYYDFSKYDILYLNWFENVDEYNIFDAIKTYLGKSLVLIRAKSRKVKILYTKHNLLPHNTRYMFLINKLYKKCFDYADQIVCFTQYSADDIKTLYPNEDYTDKINIINPINFVDSLPNKKESIVDELLYPYKGDMVITLFGWVRKYKNPLMLIEAAKQLSDKKIVFLISGVAPDNKFKKTLIEKSKGINNIILNLNRIDDTDLHALVDRTDIFITPYDINEASNSAVGRMAFSYGKTVITSNIASMKVIPNDLIYMYDYIDENDHLNKLIENIEKVYTIWSNEPKILEKQGIKLQEIMINEYSFESIREKYKKLFEKLLNNYR